MDYDAIAGREGCENDTGIDWFGLKAFERMCVSLHDTTSELFNQPPGVSYSIGPAVKGDPTQPFNSPWAAWVGGVGVRVGKLAHVDPPADDLGEHSSLYLKVKPTELSHAWNGKGDLAIAIQKDPLHIELKQYIDDAGNFATYSWRGLSPALYYTGHVIKGDPANLDQLVCYYLHPTPEQPNVLYARFESENYSVEHIVMPGLRVPLQRLINVRTSQPAEVEISDVPDPETGKIPTILTYGSRVELYAIDEDGRDVLLTTPEHIPTFFDQTSLAVALVNGGVAVASRDADGRQDDAKIDTRLNNGRVLKPLVDTDLTPTSEDASLSVALVGGDVLS